MEIIPGHRKKDIGSRQIATLAQSRVVGLGRIELEVHADNEPATALSTTPTKAIVGNGAA